MTPPERTRITGRSVYTYADELIVELTGVDADGDFVVISFQFDYSEASETVTPKGPVERPYRTEVRRGLTEAGFRWPGAVDE